MTVRSPWNPPNEICLLPTKRLTKNTRKHQQPSHVEHTPALLRRNNTKIAPVCVYPAPTAPLSSCPGRCWSTEICFSRKKKISSTLVSQLSEEQLPKGRTSFADSQFDSPAVSVTELSLASQVESGEYSPVSAAGRSRTVTFRAVVAKRSVTWHHSGTAMGAVVVAILVGHFFRPKHYS